MTHTLVQVWFTTFMMLHSGNQDPVQQDLLPFPTITREEPLEKGKYVQEVMPKYGRLTRPVPDKWSSSKVETL